jgi:hypothetical protein
VNPLFNAFHLLQSPTIFNEIAWENIMNPFSAFLLSITFGVLFLLVSMLVCRESDRSFTSAFTEWLAWGTGIFIVLSLRVLGVSR